MSEKFIRKAGKAGVYYLPATRRDALEAAAIKARLRPAPVEIPRGMHSRELLKRLGEVLDFPDWYGANFDALHDCLNEIGEPTRIVLHFAARLDHLPDGYGAKLLRVLRQAAEENPNIKLTMYNRI